MIRCDQLYTQYNPETEKRERMQRFLSVFKKYIIFMTPAANGTLMERQLAPRTYQHSLPLNCS
ncbi:hypothetical protein X777_15385 [Ooceraea biroi]|uniref:Uncharacterized protein n=1 Tax=Ooceraea biroi TaxID=2015173 RepID=A0A026VV81_OOCBI|nr:hypothetical protein X777_15385 [Ooceraea biroi]